MVVSTQTGLLGLLLQIACYCCGAELVLMLELVLLLAGLLALFSMLLPPGVVAPP